MDTMTLVGLYALAALLLGIPMGMKSITIWDEASRIHPDSNVKKARFTTFWRLVLFPLSTLDGDVGSYRYPPGILCWLYLKPRDPRGYIAFTAIFWLPRVLLIVGEWILIGLLVIVYFLLIDCRNKVDKLGKKLIN